MVLKSLWKSIAYIVAAFAAACAAPPERFQFTRVTMGVATHITVEAPNRETASEAAAAAFHRIAEIEDVASDYRPQSELMRLCRDAAPGVWRPVSEELALLLTVARVVSATTDGAFDVTVGPAVGLWREARRTGHLADAGALDRARLAIDWRAVEVDLSSVPPRARLLKPGMMLDMGGIAKGYAAEQAGRVLRARGLHRCLVALAGDVYAGCDPTGERGWRVEVRGDKDERPVGTLLVSHASVSTSGDTEQFVEIDGKRYGHIIDPRTGLGTEGGLIVTAIGCNGAYVDAIDTGAVVLGLDATRAMVQAAGPPATFVVHAGGGPPIILGDPSRVRWAEGSN